MIYTNGDTHVSATGVPVLLFCVDWQSRRVSARGRVTQVVVVGTLFSETSSSQSSADNSVTELAGVTNAEQLLGRRIQLANGYSMHSH